MIDIRKIEELVTDFNVGMIKAEGSETITEAITHLGTTGKCIRELEKTIKEMKQKELDLIQDVYNRLKPGDKPYVKFIRYE